MSTPEHSNGPDPRSSTPPTGGPQGPTYQAPPGPGHQQLPPYQQAAPYQNAAGQRMSPDSERTWAIAAHLSSFVAAYVALGFLGPLVCMLVVGDRSPYARRQAVESLNFNLSWLLYLAVSGVLSVVLIGIPFLIGFGVAYVILVIMGAVAASRGEEFRYPLTIRLVS